MNERQIKLAERRGALTNRIAGQRSQLAHHSVALARVLGQGDKLLQGVEWLKAHPLAVGGALAAVVAVRPGRAWRWGQRAVLLWRGWQMLSARLSGR